MKKIIVPVLCATALFAPCAAGAEDAVRLLIDEKQVVTEVSPIIENDRTLVPLRVISEELGKEVRWNGETQEVIISDKSGVLTLKIDNKEARWAPSGGDTKYTVSLDTAPMLINDVTMVPVRFIAERFGAEVDWDGDTESVIIKTQAVEEAKTFADELIEQMPRDKNYMISPLSIRMAFALAANGAEGETLSEMLGALYIDDIDAFNIRSKKLIDSYSDNDLLRLNIANSVWTNTSNTEYEFKKTYTDKITDFYRGTANTVTNDNAVDTINGWVSDSTNGRIQKIISAPEFEAMLINAVYFKGIWKNQFSAELTRDDVFTDGAGAEHMIPFMHKLIRMPYCEKDGIQMVELPYRYKDYEIGDDGVTEKTAGAQVSMYIILDGENPVMPESFVTSAIDNNEFQDVRLELSIPKFKMEYSTSLNEIMKTMGMNKAFVPLAAEFAPMFEKGEMYIDSALHKTYIDVDEYGTEAAAVTGVGMATTALDPDTPVRFTADKPFTFMIYDRTNSEVLFEGRYVCPEE